MQHISVIAVVMHVAAPCLRRATATVVGLQSPRGAANDECKTARQRLQVTKL